MKVLVVVRWPVGGIRTFIKYVYSNWADKNIELHFLTPNLPEVLVLKEQLGALNTKWHLTKTDRPSVLEIFKLGYSILREGNFDIVHAHGFTSAIALSPLIFMFRVKSVFTSHDALLEKQFIGFKGKIKKAVITLALNRYTRLHSVSHDSADNLVKSLPSLNKNKMVVIVSGVDTNRFYTADSIDLKSLLDISVEVTLIGFFGRFMSPKGFKYLIDAMNLLEKEQSGKFKVICFGAGAFIREEQQYISSLGLMDRFYFHDFIPDIAPYLKGCDIVAMPSLWEACGLLAMESLAAGVPLVASSCMGLREVCNGSPAIMVDPANAESLALGIVGASKADRALFEGYASIAKEKFSVKITQEKVYSLYEGLVSKDAIN